MDSAGYSSAEVISIQFLKIIHLRVIGPGLGGPEDVSVRSQGWWGMEL